MTPKDFNLRVFEGIYMKNTIIVPMLGMFFLSGFYMQASSSEKKQSKSILNRLDNTVPLVGNASSNTTSSIYGMVSSLADYKSQAALGRSLSSSKIHNNTQFPLYIGMIGSQTLFSINPNSSIAVATPYNYFIYPTNVANGPALFLTYFNNNPGTQNSVCTCYVQQGFIDESIPKGLEEKFTGTAALYKDTVRPLGHVSIFVDASGKNAFILSSL